MKKLLYSILFSFFVVLSTSFFGCSVPTYNIDYGSLNAVVEYNSDFDYLNSGLAIVKQEGKNTYRTEIQPEMVVSCDDISTVGDKKLIIKFEDKTFVINFAVKYKVNFMVGSQVINTQYVFDESEIEAPDNPTIDGCDFVGWTPNLTQEISNNTNFDAQFTVSSSGMPLLLSRNATYGDTLQSITLPQNSNGKWQFVDDLSTPVGNAGEQKFDVKFIPTNPELLSVKTDKITINVAQKELELKNKNQFFIYDGKAKQPTIEFDIEVEESKIQYTAKYQEEAINVGKYQFEINILDSNYKVSSKDYQFKILPCDVKIEIQNKTIKFTDSYPENFEYSILDKNNNPLSQELIDVMNFELVAPRYQHAGEYVITANVKNTNFNVDIIEGKLTVQKVEHNLGSGSPDFVNGANIVYGSALSTLQFSNLDNRGRWTWKDSSIKALTPTTFTATAVFTPKESRDYLVSEREVKLNVSKKTLTFNILENEFTYNSLNHFIDYEVDGIEEQDNSIIIIGNNVYRNAGTYDITLTVDQTDSRYVGSIKTTLIINKASIADFSTVYETEWSNTLLLQNIPLNSGYKWVQPLTSLTELGTQKYMAQFTPEDTQNYKTETSEISVNVVKATSSVSADEAYTFTYSPNGYELANVNGSHTESDIQYSYLQNGKEVGKISNAGTYQVVLYLPESTHYKPSSKIVDVVVNQVINTDAVRQNITNAIYLDKLSKFILPTNDFGSWAWQKGNNAEVGKAGTQIHTAIYTPTDTVNYAARQVDVVFTVAKYTVAVPAIDDKEFVNKNITSCLTGTELYKVNADIGGVELGEYSVVLELLDAENYAWSGDYAATTTAVAKYNIVKNKTNNWAVVPSISKTSWDYIDDNNRETELEGTITGKADLGDLVVLYKAATEGDDKYSIVKPINAGSYTAKVYVEETSSYVGTQPRYINFTINYISISVPQNLSTTYNGQPQKADIKDSSYYVITQNNEYTNANPENNPYIVKIKLNSINYKWEDELLTEQNTQERTFNFVINKVVNEDVVKQNITDAVYLDKLSKFTLPTNDFGTWAWQKGNSAEVGKAGTQIHTAIYTPNDAVNYAARQVEVVFTVSKKLVDLPSISNKEYSSKKITSGLTNTDLYTIQNDNGGIAVGKYSVSLLLNDANNYRWPGDFANYTVATLDYYIEVNVNSWLIEPSISKTSWYYVDHNNEGIETPGIFTAIAELGEVIIEYKLLGQDDSQFKAYTEYDRLPAGKYVARVRVEAVENAYGGLSKDNIEFTINHIPVELPIINSTIYNGNPQKADIKDSNYYVITQNNEYTNANPENNPYIVKIKLNSINYKWEDELLTEQNTQERAFDFVINKVVNEDAVKQNITDAVYLDELSKFTLPTNDFGTWSWQSGNDTKVGDVGTQIHTAIYTPTDAVNYAARQVEITFKVGKKPLEVPVVANKQYTGFDVYSGLENTELYTVSEDVGGKVVSNIPCSVTLLLTNTTSYCWQGDSTGENAYVTINYYVVQNQNNGWKTAPSISKASWDFIDKNNEGEVETGIISGEADFGSLVIKYKGLTESNDKYSLTKPTNAGNYIAKVYAEGTENYVGTKENDIKYIEFTINHISVNAPTNKTTTFNNLTQTTGYENNAYFNVSDENSQINRGSYAVVATLKDAVNYVWNDGYSNASRTFTFTINQATNGWKENCSPNITTSYKFTFADTYKPTATSLFGTPVATYYKVNEDSSLTKLNEFPHDVGSYKVEFKVEEEKEHNNYTGIQETHNFNITKATLDAFTAPVFDADSVFFENTFSITKDCMTPYVAKFEGKDIIGTLTYTAPKLATTSVLSKTVNGIARKYAKDIFFNVQFASSNFENAQANSKINLYATCYSGKVEDVLEIQYGSFFGVKYEKSRKYYQTVAVSKYYGSIENAFANNTSGDVIAIPDSSGEVVINDNITIKSGMRLILPYINASGVHEVNTLHADKFGKGTLSADDVLGFDGLVLHSKIVLKANKTITNNGAINIGGEISGGSSGKTPIAGGTARYYAKLVLEDNAKIINGGNIYCFGYIDESSHGTDGSGNGSQIIANSGSIYLPYILHDFRGGNYMKSVKNANITPFNQFEFRNIIPTIRVNNGASLIGMANLFAGLTTKENNYSPVYLVGNTSSYVFQLSDNAYLVAKYKPINKTAQDDKWAEGVNDLHFYGGATTNALTLKVMGFEVSTSSVDFPLSWRQNITLHPLNSSTPASYSMNQKFKLLTGSKFTVCEGVFLTVNSLNIYESYTDTTNIGTAGAIYKQTGPAEFNLYGTLIATNLGGTVNMKSTSAVLEVSNYTYQTYEVASCAETGNGLTNDKFTITKQTIKGGDAQGNVILKYALGGTTYTQSITASAKDTQQYVYSQAENKWVIQNKAA